MAVEFVESYGGFSVGDWVRFARGEGVCFGEVENIRIYCGLPSLITSAGPVHPDDVFERRGKVD